MRRIIRCISKGRVIGPRSQIIKNITGFTYIATIKQISCCRCNIIFICPTTPSRNVNGNLTIISILTSKMSPRAGGKIHWDVHSPKKICYRLNVSVAEVVTKPSYGNSNCREQAFSSCSEMGRINCTGNNSKSGADDAVC